MPPKLASFLLVKILLSGIWARAKFVESTYQVIEILKMGIEISHEPRRCRYQTFCYIFFFFLEHPIDLPTIVITGILILVSVKP